MVSEKYEFFAYGSAGLNRDGITTDAIWCCGKQWNGNHYRWAFNITKARNYFMWKPIKLLKKW